MRRLFLLIYRFRVFLFFLLVEFFCFLLIIKNNRFHKEAFFNSSNFISASLLDASKNISDYFYLKQINTNLVEENTKLLEQIQLLKNKADIKELSLKDSIFLKQYELKSAKVISNSTRRAINYITINKGSLDGIKPGMAVISSYGIVGHVKSTSRNFAVVTSLLHHDVKVSSLIKSSGTFCTIQWSGKTPTQADLKYVPRHIKVTKDDTVVTSGYNAIYPEGVMIGTISEISLREDATFYDISVDLSTPFQRLSYLYVVNNHLKQEQDSLREISKGIYE